MNSVNLVGGGLNAEKGNIDIRASGFELSPVYDKRDTPKIISGGDISILANVTGIREIATRRESEINPGEWIVEIIRPTLSSQGNIELGADYMFFGHALLDAGGDVNISADYFDSRLQQEYSGDVIDYSEINSGGSVNFTFGYQAGLHKTKVNAKEDINILADGELYLFGSNTVYYTDDIYSLTYKGVNFDASNIFISAESLTVDSGELKADNTLSLSSVKNMSVNGREGYDNDDGNGYSILWNPVLLSAGNLLTLDSEGDINASAVNFLSDGDINLRATGNITLTSQHDKTIYDWRSDDIQTWINTGATLFTSGRDITLDAGSNITVDAAVLIAGRDITLDTGENISLNAVATEDYKYSHGYQVQQEEHYIRQAGTEFTSGRDISLTSGQDISLQAAQLDAKNYLDLLAWGDITIGSATESDYYFYEKNTSSNNVISSTHTQTIEEDYATLEKGSLLSAGAVLLFAVNDLALTGSAVISDDELYINAGNAVALTAASEEYASVRIKNVNKSGILSGGLFGFTIGKKSSRHKVEENGITQSQSLSTLGSTAGNVIIDAGGQVDLTGADIIAARQVAVYGSDIQIQPGRDNLQRYERLEYKTQGLTLGLTGVVANIITSVIDIAHSVREAGSDRISALRGIQSMLSGVQAVQSAVVNSDQPAGQLIGISASLGQQKSVMERRDTSSIVSPSDITSGDGTTIVADNNVLIAGSRLKAGGDIALEAGQNLLLLAAANTYESSSKNSSSGGSVGITFGLGQSSGLSVTAGANYSKGRENGSITEMIETLISSGNQVSLKAGKDIALIGAQVSGDKVVVRAGNNLNLTSLQDSDSYEAKQDSISGNMSVAIYGTGSSASISASSQRINSDYQSVIEQTGIYAGSAGFDIEVQGDSWLDGAVIASQAGAEHNRLQTGTLAWRDIINSASYDTEQAAISTGTSGGGASLGDSSGQDSSRTRSALSPALLVVTAPQAQRQDITTLSRDVENANQQLSPIFDLNKEQKRLQTLQLLGEIGAQVADIARTQGQIEAIKAGKAELTDKGIAEPDENGTAEDWAEYNALVTATDSYKTAQQQWGTGSTIQQAIQAATAALQGLTSGDIAQALSGASAPYLAEQIHNLTNGNPEAKAIAHAVSGALTAYMSGHSALAGAAGAVSGELMAELVMNQLYPGKDVSELSETDKQTISILATLTAGLANGITGSSAADAIAGALAGKNAAENNYLSGKDITTFAEKYANAKTEKEKEQLWAALKKLDVEQQAQALSTGISIADQKQVLADLKTLSASPDCNTQCQELVTYSIAELEPVTNNTQLHEDNLKKGVLAAVIYALTVEKPASSGSDLSSLTKEQQRLIRNAENITTARGIQNPFPRDLNEKILWSQVKANPSAGEVLKGMNKDPHFPASAGFQKMQVTHELPDGSNITIHYQYNSNTGKAYDMKMVTPQANPLQPGPSLKGK
ncbi:hemagglutinin repeat-containing protein [Phytobacter sp. V91]|uniref:hemagglutinin repeat-containing protein n=1 Tax=Phytobacter sp. V91 TaxID=3369425 RepID=UPI003F620175